MQNCNEVKLSNQVTTVSEAIAALQTIQVDHGNLPMLNVQGGPFRISVDIWSDEDRQKAGCTAEELSDSVSIEGVHAAGPGCLQREAIEVIHQNLSKQIAAGQVLYDLINFEDGDEPDPRYPGLPILWKNIFNNLQASCGELDALMAGMKLNASA